MSTNYAKHVSPKITPQTETVPGKPTVANNAGGFSFVVTDWKRLERFLVLGAEGGTFYVKEKELTKDNAQVVQRCLSADPKRTVDTIVSISDAGRAPKNDQAVFALALAASHSSNDAKKAAYDALTKVCRTGTHLFQFVSAVDQLRGWGTGLRKAIARWYNDKNPNDLGYQVTKYQQREGWSHKDVLRLSHATPYASHEAMYRWILQGLDGLGERTVIRGKGDKAVSKTYPAVSSDQLPVSIHALEQLKKAATVDECVKLIEQYADKAPRELIPTQFLTDKKVWGALLPHMPVTAMLRNLGNLSKCGLLSPLSEAEKTVRNVLTDSARLKKARVHPLSILVALKTYQQGHGMKGSGEWTAVQSVVDALNEAFYTAFDAVEPTGKRWVFGLDVSGSMSSLISGMPISCCEAATVLAMVSARIEPYTFTGRFNTGFEAVPFGRETRLDLAMRYTDSINGGGTDCSLPMMFAMQQKIPADVFVVLTDSETYAGRIHPFQALQQYRLSMGIPAKMIVVGMVSTGFTIADPSDAGSLDVVGFSVDVPSVMSDFVRN